MIRKENKLIITFRTTTEAMAMERACKESGADGRLIPVPKSITAGCGLAWCAKPECSLALQKVMEDAGIVPEGIHECMV